MAPADAVESFVRAQRVHEGKQMGVTSGLPLQRCGFPWVPHGFPEGFLAGAVGWWREKAASCRPGTRKLKSI